ncbi:hypothetical protein [Endozoicomonas arenosclerae]|uniref:hypothetical protein n=1 Tax=Endozoicomonas arenosclerae TaxID=1633495 RepID=UPI00078531DD|nr:hypothetical protein [Endozoicomonas arenosclerae]
MDNIGRIPQKSLPIGRGRGRGHPRPSSSARLPGTLQQVTEVRPGHPGLQSTAPSTVRGRGRGHRPFNRPSIQTTSVAPSIDDSPRTGKVKEQEHLERKVSEALEELEGLQGHPDPVDRCRQVVSRMDQVLALSYIKRDVAKQQYVYQEMLPLYLDALKACLKPMAKASHAMDGRRYLSVLLELIQYAHLLKRDHAEVYAELVNCVGHLLDAELEYLEARVYYKDRRGADWSVPHLRRILLDRNPSCCMSLLNEEDATEFQSRLRYVQGAVRKQPPKEKPDWWCDDDNTLETVSCEEAERLIYSGKDPHPFYKRYLSDVLMDQVLEVEKEFGEPASRPLEQNVAFLEALNYFIETFPESSCHHSGLHSCLKKLTGYVVRTVLIACQSRENADRFLTGKRMELIRNLAENHWLSSENRALLESVLSSGSGSESALTDLEVKSSLKEISRFMKSDQTLEDGFRLIKELTARKAEIARLPAGKHLIQELESAYNVIYAVRFKKMFQDYTKAFRSVKNKKNEYWEVCHSLRNKRKECMRSHPYTFILDDEHREKWGQLVCKSFGVDMTYLASAKVIDQEYEDKLVVLKALAPDLRCSNTRIKVKSGLVNILTIALKNPGSMQISPAKVDEFCLWLEGLMGESHSKTEHDVDVELKESIQTWRSLSPGKRLALGSRQGAKHWPDFALFQSKVSTESESEATPSPVALPETKAEPLPDLLQDLVPSQLQAQPVQSPSPSLERQRDRKERFNKRELSLEPVISQTSPASVSAASSDKGGLFRSSPPDLCSGEVRISTLEVDDPGIIEVAREPVQPRSLPPQQAHPVPVMVAPMPVMVPVYPVAYCVVFPVVWARNDLLQKGIEQIYTATAQWSMNTGSYAQKRILPKATKDAVERGLKLLTQYLQGVNSPMIPPEYIEQTLRQFLSRDERGEVARLFNSLIYYHSGYANLALVTNLVATRDALFHIRGLLGLPVNIT